MLVRATRTLIVIFRTRPSDNAHATLDRISIVADNLNTAMVKAKSLFDTLDTPQIPDGLRIFGSSEARIVRLGSGCHGA
jgi:hypothetical protein